MKLRWRFGVLAGIFLAIFCLYPQFKMLYLRGDDWNGHYAYNDIDEVAYASYVRALTDGRPRKNDPYTGRDDSPDTPQPESLFSIQFAAPYTIAIPARVLGVGTPWAMTIAGAFAGFLAAFAAFWLIGRMTGDNWYAMAAALAVFALVRSPPVKGRLSRYFSTASPIPISRGFGGTSRRSPCLLFCVCCVALGDIEWRRTPKPRGKPAGPEVWSPPFLLISICVLSFAYCVFSYFYIWTTAAAFLACVGLVWLVERPVGWKRDVRNLAILGSGCLIPLIPYFYLLSKRTDTMDHVQLLLNTHAPDFFRFPEYVSFAVLILLIAGLAAKVIDIKERLTLFALALAFVSFVIFNQQVITGRSLQPIHFQVFIGNYVSTLALFVTIGILWKGRLGQGGLKPRIACSLIAVAAVAWGFIECHYTVRVLDEANVERDKALPIANRLSELAKIDHDPHRTTILSFDWLFADDMPTVAPKTFFGRVTNTYLQGLSWEESKERYYQQLFYQKVDDGGLDYLLKNDFVTQIALFGWGRHTDRLSVAAKPLTYGEIAEEVKKYGDYCQSFSKTHASNPLISFVVVPNDRPFDLSAIEQWYEFDEGEVIGGHTLYKAHLR